MTTTLRPPDKPRINGTARPTAGTKPPAKQTTVPRRNRTRIGLGVLVIVVAVLGVVALVGRSNERREVLVLSRDVPAGATVEAGDLTSAALPIDAGISTVAIGDLDTVVGRAASVSLIQGTVLSPRHLSSEARVPEGMALLGAVLDPGQYPVGLREGDQVILVETGASADSQPVDLGQAEVREIAEPPTGGSALVVSLLVPLDAAENVSTAGAQGRISLVVVGTR